MLEPPLDLPAILPSSLRREVQKSLPSFFRHHAFYRVCGLPLSNRFPQKERPASRFHAQGILPPCSRLENCPPWLWIAPSWQPLLFDCSGLYLLTFWTQAEGFVAVAENVVAAFRIRHETIEEAIATPSCAANSSIRKPCPLGCRTSPISAWGCVVHTLHIQSITNATRAGINRTRASKQGPQPPCEPGRMGNKVEKHARTRRHIRC